MQTTPPLVGVVADLAIVFAIQFLPGSVGGGRDNRLSRAPFDLGNVEMEQGQLSAFLLVSGLAHQGGNFRQGKDLFHQKKKGPFAHAVHLRAILSTAPPRVISRWFRFFLSPWV